MQNMTIKEMQILMQKMIFIDNAIMSGWTVKLVGENKFQFKQKRINMKQEVLLDDYLRKFVRENMNNIRN